MVWPIEKIDPEAGWQEVVTGGFPRIVVAVPYTTAIAPPVVDGADQEEQIRQTSLGCSEWNAAIGPSKRNQRLTKNRCERPAWVKQGHAIVLRGWHHVFAGAHSVGHFVGVPKQS